MGRAPHRDAPRFDQVPIAGTNSWAPISTLEHTGVPLLELEGHVLGEIGVVVQVGGVRGKQGVAACLPTG